VSTNRCGVLAAVVVAEGSAVGMASPPGVCRTDVGRH
jgi:hypothetical protein